MVATGMRYLALAGLVLLFALHTDASSGGGPSTQSRPGGTGDPHFAGFDGTRLVFTDEPCFVAGLRCVPHACPLCHQTILLRMCSVVAADLTSTGTPTEKDTLRSLPGHNCT
jgi:hypothetical protein